MASFVKDIDKGWNRIQAQLRKLDGSYTKVGYPEEKTGDKQVESGGGDFNLAGLAATMNDGTTEAGRNHDVVIPARPFMTNAFETGTKTASLVITREYNAVLAGKRIARKALSRVGEWFVGKIKKEITQGDFEDIKQATIDRRTGKSTKPLIDTGQLRNSVTHVEVMKL